MLTIDPSLHRCGWAILHRNTIADAGVLVSSKKHNIESLLTGLFRNPLVGDNVVVEVPNRIDPGIPPMRIVKLGYVVGMVRLLAYQHNLRLQEVNPTQYDKTHTEYRVRKEVPDISNILRKVPESYRHNAYDAVHLALVWNKRLKYASKYRSTK